ncbi:MAG: class I SAM-dependent methyltransferase [archaeon]
MTKRVPSIFDNLWQCESHDKQYAQNFYDIEEGAANLFTLDAQFVTEQASPGLKVLDAMCGPGRHVIQLARKGFDVTGNDYNAHMVSTVRQSLENEGLTARLTNYDVIESTEFPDGEFDYVFSMFHSLGTIPGGENRQYAVDEMARVLKPGGSIAIHGHNLLGNLYHEKFPQWTIPHLVQQQEGYEIGDLVVNGYGNDAHTRSPSFIHLHMPWELAGYITNAGLKIIEFHFLDYTKIERTTIAYSPEDSGALTAIGHQMYKSDGLIVVGKKI